MTEPLPWYRVTSDDGRTAVVEVGADDFARVQLVMSSALVGTAAGDAMIRGAIERRGRDRDVARDGGAS